MMMQQCKSRNVIRCWNTAGLQGWQVGGRNTAGGLRVATCRRCVAKDLRNTKCRK